MFFKKNKPIPSQDAPRSSSFGGGSLFAPELNPLPTKVSLESPLAKSFPEDSASKPYAFFEEESNADAFPDATPVSDIPSSAVPDVSSAYPPSVPSSDAPAWQSDASFAASSTDASHTSFWETSSPSSESGSESETPSFYSTAAGYSGDPGPNGVSDAILPFPSTDSSYGYNNAEPSFSASDASFSEFPDYSASSGVADFSAPPAFSEPSFSDFPNESSSNSLAWDFSELNSSGFSGSPDSAESSAFGEPAGFPSASGSFYEVSEPSSPPAETTREDWTNLLDHLTDPAPETFSASDASLLSPLTENAGSFLDTVNERFYPGLAGHEPFDTPAAPGAIELTPAPESAFSEAAEFLFPESVSPSDWTGELAGASTEETLPPSLASGSSDSGIYWPDNSSGAVPPDRSLPMPDSPLPSSFPQSSLPDETRMESASFEWERSAAGPAWPGSIETELDDATFAGNYEYTANPLPESSSFYSASSLEPPSAETLSFGGELSPTIEPDLSPPAVESAFSAWAPESAAPSAFPEIFPSVPLPPKSPQAGDFSFPPPIDAFSSPDSSVETAFSAFDAPPFEMPLSAGSAFSDSFPIPDPSEPWSEPISPLIPSEPGAASDFQPEAPPVSAFEPLLPAESIPTSTVLPGVIPSGALTPVAGFMHPPTPAVSALQAPLPDPASSVPPPDPVLPTTPPDIMPIARLGRLGVLGVCSLTVDRRLLVVHNGEVFALMAQKGSDEEFQVTVLKILDRNPLAYQSTFTAVPDTRADQQGLYMIQVGSLHGVVSVFKDTVALHSDLA